jgi:protoporphyrinogen oxidase
MLDNKRSKQITILGGGLAGLAVGYYAKKHKFPFTIYEATERTGGNAITLTNDDFLFDSGAHRLHDKDPAVTAAMKQLLGKSLNPVNIPSQIYYQGKLINFPFLPLNLLQGLGFTNFTKSGIEVVSSRLFRKKSHPHFEHYARNTYGNTISSRLLLNYSEKLWGVPCNRLLPSVAGKRLKGLTLKTLLRESVFGKTATVEHVEGSFYYPDKGIGLISEKIAEFCGYQNIVTNAQITGVFHNHHQILAVEYNHHKKIEIEELVNTIPLPDFIRMMQPPLPDNINRLAKKLQYRNLVLVALFLNRPMVTSAATVYFPDSEFIFTRIYEPRNRSHDMAPPGKTSLVAEIPCQPEGAIWSMDDAKLVEQVVSKFIELGWINKKEIIDTAVHRMQYAYPILELGSDEKVHEIMAYLARFENLRFSGRSGRFVYSWIHDMMKFGKEIIDEYSTQTKQSCDLIGLSLIYTLWFGFLLSPILSHIFIWDIITIEYSCLIRSSTKVGNIRSCKPYYTPRIF